MCVRGCSILRQCALIMRMSVVWLWELFYARWTCILCGRASFCIGCFAYDTCMFMVIKLPCTYLCTLSAVLARLCIFYCIANRCVYSSECDGCTCRECHIHCSTRWCENLYWSALNLDGCWAREVGFRFWKHLSWCIRHLHVHGDWITMSLQTPDIASVWGPTQFL